MAKEMRTGRGEDTEIAQKECNGRLGPVAKREKIGGGQWKETDALAKNLGKR